MKTSSPHEGNEEKGPLAQIQNTSQPIQVEVVRQPQRPAKAKSWVEHLRDLLGLSETVIKIVVLAILVVSFVVWREDIRRRLLNVESVEAFGVKLTFKEKVQILNKMLESNGNNVASIWYARSDEAKRAIRRVRGSALVFRQAWILWVDDNPINNRELIDFFESLGAHVTTALGTQEAMDRVKRLEKIDLIISDLMRDGKVEAGDSGTNTLMAFRKQEKGPNETPFLFFSDKAEEIQLPAKAQGKTNNAWDLLQLVTDQLERCFYAKQLEEHSSDVENEPDSRRPASSSSP